MTLRGASNPRLVSAITIFLNGGHFLEEAIQSVIAQTHPAWELLLVDDGSTDGASELAREYANRYPDQIRYLDHEGHRNRGMSASRNLGLQHARGAFVAFLDGDDVWMPEKLERQVAILDAHPEAGMTCGATRVWYSWTGQPGDAARDTLRTVHKTPDGLYQPPEMLRRYLRDEVLTPATCSVLLRREALALTGGFEERFTGLYEDQAFFVKVYLKLGCFVTSEANDLYRQHGASHVAVALQSGRYSFDRPSAALVGLHLWCIRYLVRERVSDGRVWMASITKLRDVSLGLLWPRLQRLRERGARLLGVKPRGYVPPDEPGSQS